MRNNNKRRSIISIPLLLLVFIRCICVDFCGVFCWKGGYFGVFLENVAGDVFEISKIAMNVLIKAGNRRYVRWDPGCIFYDIETCLFFPLAR